MNRLQKKRDKIQNQSAPEPTEAWSFNPAPWQSSEPNNFDNFMQEACDYFDEGRWDFIEGVLIAPVYFQQIKPKIFSHQKILKNIKTLISYAMKFWIQF